MPSKPTKRFQRKGLIRRRIAQNDKRVQTILLDAKAKIDARILKATNDKRIATSAAWRNALYKDVGAIYKDMGGSIDTWGAKMAETTGKQWHGFGSDDIPKDKRIPWGKFSKKHVEDYIAIVHPANAGQLAAVSSLASQDIRFLRAQFVDVFREASVTGIPIRKMAQEMKARMTATRPDWKFVDSAGRKWKPENYFNMLSRTTVAEVSRKSYDDTIAGAGIDLVMIAGGQPTVAPPDPCWRWYNKIVSLTGETPGYPTIDDARADGLFHPNCIHYTAAILDDELPEFEEKEATTDANRKAAEDKATAEAEALKEADRQELAEKKAA